MWGSLQEDIIAIWTAVTRHPRFGESPLASSTWIRIIQPAWDELSHCRRRRHGHCLKLNSNLSLNPCLSQMLVKYFRCQNIYLWTKISIWALSFLSHDTNLKRSWPPLTNDLRLLHKFSCFWLVNPPCLPSIICVKGWFIMEQTTRRHYTQRKRVRCVPAPCFRVCSSNLVIDGEENIVLILFDIIAFMVVDILSLWIQSPSVTHPLHPAWNFFLLL